MKIKKVRHEILIEDSWELIPVSDTGVIPQYDVAFLLAPDIKIPNKSGMAIAELVKTLAGGMSYKSVVFSSNPDEVIDNPGTIGCDIAYYKKDFVQSIWDTGPIFTRIKALFITPIRYAWREYAFDAAEACIRLGVKCLVVEDVADFCWVARHVREHDIKIVLHQHAFTQRNYRIYLWRRIERHLDRIIFVAYKTLRMSEDKYGKINVPADVIYNAVDIAHYNPDKWIEDAERLKGKLSISPHDRVFTFVGRLAFSKGVIEAIKAYRLLGRRDLHFIIIGGLEKNDKDSFLEDFKSLKDELINNNYPVHFFKNIPQTELPVYYGITDYLLVPSNNNYEGLPKVVTEALAMGVPVIASDRGGIWELLEEGRNGWKINDPVSPESIHKAINEAMKTDDAQLLSMKQGIIKIDRPKMNQRRMIRLFQEELSRIIDL